MTLLRKKKGHKKITEYDITVKWLRHTQLHKVHCLTHTISKSSLVVLSPFLQSHVRDLVRDLVLDQAKCRHIYVVGWRQQPSIPYSILETVPRSSIIWRTPPGGGPMLLIFVLLTRCYTGEGWLGPNQREPFYRPDGRVRRPDWRKRTLLPIGFVCLWCFIN